MALAVDEPMIESAPPARAAPTEARTRLLVGSFNAMEAAGISYCVTHGFAELPGHLNGDVDMVVAPPALAGALPRSLIWANAETSSRLVQWLVDGAAYAVAAGPPVDGTPPLVQMHFSPGFDVAGRRFYTAAEILAGRRRYNGFWVPAPAIEFGCILVNRVNKQLIKRPHADRLAALYREDAAGCEREARRLWPTTGPMLIAAARDDRWGDVQAHLPALRDELFGNSRCRAPGAGKLARFARRLRRWTRPANGLHLVFLGPDGVGKSTIIEHVREALLPAFLRTDYLTFAPSLIPGPLQPKKDMPHQLPPRSYPASLLKAAWWSVCYTVGYYATVRPAKARASLVLNHRYLLDAMVDAKRYRYAGPRWPLRAIWLVAPKPDVIFLLNAPPEMIQRRKQEVPPEETARQCAGYRAIVERVPMGRIIDASRPIAEVAAHVNAIVIELLAARTRRQVDAPQ